MSFSMFIRKIRNQFGMNQEQLARALNVSFSTVNRWENGKAKPSPMARKALNDFYRKYGIDVDMERRQESD